ncbi:FAD binding domain-containing protein [Xanthobacteraceae bacterium Astr-EGSB]|uniref:FAD binding domain-containing protein n=1 Tax=Astrobacterium formosum TaxID=3069710 RepID=UPI0027B7AB5E|nr:FAD binding domain-containing protein [Xanthobacteraceae bacterium Astr-EGSB]
MAQTEFFRPGNLAAALDLLDQYREQAVIVNGGTDIVERIAHGGVRRAAIIYIHEIPELRGIGEGDGFVRIGGAVTYNDILASPLCCQFTALEQAVKEIGSPSIRVRGTPAGNLGTAVPAGDCCAAMMALDAEVVAASRQGERAIKLADLIIDYRRTALAANELIREIRIPVVPGGKTASAFLRLTSRKGQDIAQASAAVRLTLDGDVCRHAVIAMGSVSKVTVRAYSLEKAVAGKTVADAAEEIKAMVPAEVALRAADNPAFAARPTANIERQYKESVIGVIVARAMMTAYGKILAGEQ